MASQASTLAQFLDAKAEMRVEVGVQHDKIMATLDAMVQRALQVTGFDPKRVIAVFRPPPEGALYHQMANRRFDDTRTTPAPTMQAQLNSTIGRPVTALPVVISRRPPAIPIARNRL